MVDFPISFKQCFCTTLRNIQTQNWHLFTQCHMIILLKTLKNTLCIDFLSIVLFRYRNSLQQMFEMSCLRNSRLQTLSPLACGRVDNTLLQTAPNVNQSLLDFVDIVDLHLVLNDSNPKSCSRRGSGLDCWGKWNHAKSALVIRASIHSPALNWPYHNSPRRCETENGP